MFARANEAIEAYLKMARAYDHTWFGTTFNTHHKGPGIKRALDYRDGIKKLEKDEDALIRTIYNDVSAGLDTSTDLRAELVYALFERLGKSKAEVSEIYNQTCEENYHLLVTGNVVSNVPPGKSEIITNMVYKLTDLMLNKGYTLDKPSFNHSRHKDDEKENKVEMLRRNTI